MRRGRGAAARFARISVWTLAALVALVLVVTVGVPLVVRGPVLAGLVAHESKSLCGSIKVTGGHVSAGVALALLRQRPFDVAIDGLVLRTPAGEDMFRARTVRTKVTVLRRPWRVVLEQGLIADGAWKLVDKGIGEPLMAALDRVPAGGRAQCGAPKPPKPAKPQQQGELLTVKSVALSDFTVVLSFEHWAVTLETADARGGLQVRGKGNETQVLFDVRDIDAKHGGSLRIGPAGRPLTPEVPFDRVAIGRVAVVDSAPQNLLLEVDGARTAQAVLSGKAVFTDILGPGGGPPPGMKLDARWTAIGQALARNPAWADVGRRLARLDAGLDVSLRGPFEALVGTAALAGKGASLNARLLPEQRYALDVALDALDTEPLIPASRRDLLGGRLDGRIAVSAQLAPAPIGPSVSVDRLELDLTRSRQAAGPRRIVIGRAAGASSRDELRIGVGVISLRREVLRIASLRARGPGVELATSLRAERQRGSGAFLFEAATEPASRVAVRGETFVLPQLVRVRFEPGRAVAVQPFSIGRVGGGAIDVGGSMRPDGSAELRAAVRGYPLAHIPGLAAVRAPGQAAPMARVLGGQLDASFRLAGSMAQPRLSGELATTGVRWAGRQLGGGRVVFHGVADGTRFEGAIIDGVEVRGQLRRHARRDDFVAVSVRDVRLGGWLPRPAAALDLRASGDVVVRAPGRARLTSATADVSVSGAGVAVNARASLQPERGTATVHGHVDLGRLDISQLRAALPALRVRSAAGVIAADVSWQAAGGGGAGGAGLWPYARYPQALAGAAGTIAVVEGLSVSSARLPAAVTVPPTKIDVGGDGIRVPRLEVHMGDAYATLADGRVHDIDWRRPQDGAIAGALTASVDGRGLGRWLGDGVTSGGAARFAGQVSGSVRAPRVAGKASFDNLTVSWPGSPIGTVQVNGPIGVDGRALAVGPLMVRMGNGGWLTIAGSKGAGRLTVAPGGALLPIHDVDLTVEGGGLGTTRPVSGLSVKELALGLRLAQDGINRLRLTGEVRLGPTVFDLREQRKGATADAAKKPKAAPAKRPGDRPNALDRIIVDVRLTGPDDAVTVRVPYVPDVTVGLNCRLRGALASPRLAGEVRGSGAYSRAALTTADRFTDRNLRRCDLAPR